MSLKQIRTGSWSASTSVATVTGGFSWNEIIGNGLANSLLIQRMYFGSFAFIDLGAGVDRITWDVSGTANLDLRNVEFLNGTARTLSTVTLLSVLGNTLTTNGGISNLYGTVRNDTITVTGNRAMIMQDNGSIISGSGKNLIDLRVGDDRLILVNDIDRTNFDRYDGGTGANILELRNTTAGMLTVTFTGSDLDIQRFQTVFLNNAGNGNITADFTAQTEDLLIYDALTTAVAASSGNDTITGGSGNDTIYARGGFDEVNGGIGADTIYGGTGFDNISGGVGDDTLYGNAGTYNGVTGDQGNRITGNAGSDIFMVGYADGVTGATVPSGYSATSNPYGADVIQDWSVGTDALTVSTAGVAIIGGLNTDASLAGSNSISLRVGVTNAGLIVARGKAGSDSLQDSTGVDYLYGNTGNNQINLSAGGNDRAYVDTISGKQYINGFSNGDLVYLDKGVVNGLGQNTTRAGTITNASGGTGNGQQFNTGVDYLYANYYFSRLSNFGSGPYSNAQHNSANDYGDAGKTTPIGAGLVSAGAVLLACTFGIVGASLVVAGGLLLADAQQHQNITYGGAFNNNSYLNLMQQSRSVNTTAGVNDDGVAFLDFFLNRGNVGDGFTPVLELTNKSGAAGIYGFVAVHSDDETFIFLVRSADNLIENHEAIKIAEINGILGTSDFVIYDGSQDIYNPGADPILALVEPTISAADAGASTAGADIANGGVTTADKATLTVSLSPALGATATTIDLYDGSTYVTSVTRSSTSSTTITDSRTMSASVEQVDRDSNGNLFAVTGDNLFRYDYTYAYYSVWVNDAATGYVTKSGVWAVTYMGIDPATVIDGGAGFDTLMIEETAAHLNSVSDANLLNIEMIDASGAEQGVTVTLTTQSEGLYVSGSDFNDILTGGGGADTLVGNKGADQLFGGNGNDIFVYSELYDKNTVPASGNTAGATVDFTAAQAFAGDTVINGGGGTDILRFIGGVTLTDLPFADATSIEQLDLDNSSSLNSVTLGANAQAAGVYYIDGSNGADTINWDYNTLAVTIYGLGGDDIIDNDANDGMSDTVDGGVGNDTIRVGGGNDVVIGGDGNDAIHGEGGDDTLTGNADNDALTGGTGADTFNVDAGNDTITDLGDGADIVKVESGATLSASAAAAWTATSGSYNKASAASAATITASGYSINLSAVTGTTGWTVTNSSNATGVALTGSSFADAITGGSGNDTIVGGAGADILTGNAGNDAMTGGTGADTFNVDAGSDTITDLSDGADIVKVESGAAMSATAVAAWTATSASYNKAAAASAATVTASGYNIDLSAVTGTTGWTVTNSGNATGVTLTGSGFADTISGGGGGDTIAGGSGADTLVGNFGNDTFLFVSSAELAGDTSVDGGANQDTIYITAADSDIADAEFANVGGVEQLQLTGASSVTLGARATIISLNTVITGNDTTSVTRTDSTATTINANSLANDKVLTIDDSGATTNFTVNNLTGDLVATDVLGTIAVDLNDNTTDNDISISIGQGNATISGGHASDTLTVVQAMSSGSIPVSSTVDLSGSASNVDITVGGGIQTIKAGTGVYSIRTGAGDATGMDRVEFTVSGSATANINLTGSDADVMARISTFLDYNDDVIDFIGADTAGANISSGGLTTNASGVITSFGAGASSTLAEKIATVRAALDGQGSAGNNSVVAFTHTSGGQTDTYAYGTGTSALNDDQIVRIANDSLNSVVVGSSFILTVAPPTSALTLHTSLLPNDRTWYDAAALSVTPSGFTPGNDGSSSGGDGVNGATSQLIRNGSGNFGTQMGSGDDYSVAVSVPAGMWSSGLDMFGANYTTVHMGSNGYLTFGSGFSGYIPSGIDSFTRSPMIAAQFDDLYTGAGARNIADGAGNGTSLNSHNMYYYSTPDMLVFTWDNVGLYSNGVSDSQTNAGGKGSAFQIILHKLDNEIAASTSFGIEIRYEEISQEYAGATAGWTAGDRVNFSLINPTKTNLFSIAGSGSNVDVAGVWAWQVEGGYMVSDAYLPDVGLTTRKDTALISVRGIAADPGNYLLGGEAASQFTISSTGTNAAKLTTIPNATFNLWKDAYVDMEATVTVTPRTSSGLPGATETIDILLTRNLDGDAMPGDADKAVRTAGSNTITVAAGGVLTDAADSDLGTQNIVVGAAIFTAITTITATGSGSTINVSNQSEGLTLNGNSGIDTITGGSGNDVITGGQGADSLVGNAGDDVFIIALAGQHAGGETITGGTHSSGDEIRFTSTAGGTLALLAGVTEIETVRISNAAGVSTGTTAENVDASLVTGAIDLIGNDGANILTGNSSANTISGGAGNDTLSGAGGADILTGNAGNDAMTGGTGADTFNVDAGSDTITDLSDGADIVKVESGASMSATAAGAWTATSASYNNAASQLAASIAASGYDIDVSAVTGTSGWTVDNRGQLGSVTLTGSNFDDDFYGGSGNDIVSGGAGDDLLYGDPGNDTLTGGTGDDWIVGDAGNDTYNIDAGDDYIVGFGNGADILKVETGASVTVNMHTGGNWTATSSSYNNASSNAAAVFQANNYSVDLLAATGISGWTITNQGGASAVTLTGSSLADIITGGAGNDTLSGGGGADILTGNAGNDAMTGGTGADTFNVDVGSDTISDLGEGADIVKVESGASMSATAVAAWTATSASYNNAAAASAATITASGRNIDLSAVTGTTGWTVTNSGNATAVTLTGSGFADTLTGGLGADTLTGGSGADSLNFGGADSSVDTAVYADGHTYVGVVVNATTSIGSGVDVIQGAMIGDKIDLSAISGLTLANGSRSYNQFYLDGTASNALEIVRGTYVGGAFTAGTNSSDDDYLLQYSGGSSSTNVNSIVIMNYSNIGMTVDIASEVLTLNEAPPAPDALIVSAVYYNVGNTLNPYELWVTFNEAVLSGASAVDETKLRWDFNGDTALSDNSGFFIGNQITGQSSGTPSVLRFAFNGGQIRSDEWEGGTFAGPPSSAGFAGLVPDTLDALAGLTSDLYGNTSTAVNDVVIQYNWLGSSGADTIYGGSGADWLYGEGGNDTIFGLGGADTIVGGAGNDTIYLSGADTVNGSDNDGSDTFIYQTYADFNSSVIVTGGRYDFDQMLLEDSGAYLFGANVTGIESLVISEDAAGWDIRIDAMGITNALNTVYFSSDVSMTNGITLYFNAPGAFHEIVIDATNLGGDDTITGGIGTDTLRGGAGADVLTGGGANDTLTGGTGADTFVFAGSALGNGVDTIDFSLAEDRLNLSAFLPGGSASSAYLVNTSAASTTNVTGKVALLLSGLGDSVGDIDTAAEVAGAFTTVYGSNTVLTLDAGGKAVIISGEDTSAQSAYIWFVHDVGLDGVTASDVSQVGFINSIQFTTSGLSSSNFVFG